MSVTRAQKKNFKQILQDLDKIDPIDNIKDVHPSKVVSDLVSCFITAIGHQLFFNIFKKGFTHNFHFLSGKQLNLIAKSVSKIVALHSPNNSISECAEKYYVYEKIEDPEPEPMAMATPMPKPKPKSKSRAKQKQKQKQRKRGKSSRRPAPNGFINGSYENDPRTPCAPPTPSNTANNTLPVYRSNLQHIPSQEDIIVSHPFHKRTKKRNAQNMYRADGNTQFQYPILAKGENSLDSSISARMPPLPPEFALQTNHKMPSKEYVSSLTRAVSGFQLEQAEEKNASPSKKFTLRLRRHRPHSNPTSPSKRQRMSEQEADAENNIQHNRYVIDRAKRQSYLDTHRLLTKKRNSKERRSKSPRSKLKLSKAKASSYHVETVKKSKRKPPNANPMKKQIRFRNNSRSEERQYQGQGLHRKFRAHSADDVDSDLQNQKHAIKKHDYLKKINKLLEDTEYSDVDAHDNGNGNGNGSSGNDSAEGPTVFIGNDYEEANHQEVGVHDYTSGPSSQSLSRKSESPLIDDRFMDSFLSFKKGGRGRINAVPENMGVVEPIMPLANARRGSRTMLNPLEAQNGMVSNMTAVTDETVGYELKMPPAKPRIRYGKNANIDYSIYENDNDSVSISLGLDDSESGTRWTWGDERYNSRDYAPSAASGGEWIGGGLTGSDWLMDISDDNWLQD